MSSKDVSDREESGLYGASDSSEDEPSPALVQGSGRGGEEDDGASDGTELSDVQQPPTLSHQPPTLPKEPAVEDCCICTCPLVPSSIPIVLPCTHSGHYNCLMGVVNGLCPLCRAPIPRELKRRVYIAEDPYRGREPPLWIYASRDNRTWWYFDVDVADEIEAACEARLPSLKVSIRGQLYTVDLRRMVQVSPDGATRAIRRRDPHRDPEGIKGFAGAVPRPSS
jgi:hypothetical protein